MCCKKKLVQNVVINQKAVYYDSDTNNVHHCNVNNYDKMNKRFYRKINMS